MQIIHTDSIEWPNGQGYTPCSAEYASVTDEVDAMSDFGRIGMDEMSPADYQTYNVLLAKRDMLLMSGHVGKSHRYKRNPIHLAPLNFRLDRDY